MRDEDPICRDLKIKQHSFFVAAEARGFKVADIAQRTGIPIATLGTYKFQNSRETTLMGLATFIKLAKHLPELTDLISQIIDDTDLMLAPKDPRAADWLALGEKAASFASKVCRFQSTGGHIDHREDAELRGDMITILSEGHGVLGAGQ